MVELLSAIPMLLGPSNLEYWSDMLRSVLAYNDLEEHIQRDFPRSQVTSIFDNGVFDFGDAIDPGDDKLIAKLRDHIEEKRKEYRAMMEEPHRLQHRRAMAARQEWDDNRKILDTYLTKECPEWARQGRLPTIMIKASLGKVYHELVAAGWDPANPSAKYHYEFVRREVPKMSQGAGDDKARLEDQTRDEGGGGCGTKKVRFGDDDAQQDGAKLDEDVDDDDDDDDTSTEDSNPMDTPGEDSEEADSDEEEEEDDSPDPDDILSEMVSLGQKHVLQTQPRDLRTALELARRLRDTVDADSVVDKMRLWTSIVALGEKGPNGYVREVIVAELGDWKTVMEKMNDLAVSLGYC